MPTLPVAPRLTARFLLLAMLLAAFVTVTPAPAEAAIDSSLEQRMLDAVNAERASRGLDRLRAATDLRSVARTQSRTMADQQRLHHTTDLGSKVTNWTRLAENVGRGPSAGTIHSALMDSTGHRANILDARLTEIGVGVEVRNGQLWVTQVFRLPARSTAVSFRDVDTRGTHGPQIVRLAETAVTLGCREGRFCPTNQITRSEMASFVARAAALRPRDGQSFVDVDPGTVHQFNIEAIRHAAITQGCGGSRYCPQATVTRGEMASFLARARNLPLGDGTTRFRDVTDGSTHAAAIEAIAAAGYTGGCDTGRFCPDQPVSRAEMASFLVRGFGL